MKVRVTTQYSNWFKGLKDNRAKAKISIRINRIEAGNLGVSKSVGAGVSELVIDYGPGYRVYFGKKGNEIIILLAGSTKQNQQKTIDESKKLWSEIKN